MSSSLLPVPKDLAITWSNASMSGDISTDLLNRDFLLENPLLSCVMVSLFSDRIAPDILNSAEKSIGISPSGNAANAFQKPRKGWWADSLGTDQIGSRLWQLQRILKANKSSVLLEVQAVVYEALMWMIDKGVAQSINVVAGWVAGNTDAVSFSVSIEQPRTSGADNFTFQLAWNNL
ncbi:hypothetical protein FAI40_01595 [Acetobacteraceae bacterium]|nr:hypothetical protein FAI40_01595 [Acetobacteraceae bacterium]